MRSTEVPFRFTCAARAGRFDFFLQLCDFFGTRPVQRGASRQRVSHFSGDGEIRRRTCCRIARAAQPFRLHRSQSAAFELRQLKILEEELKEFFGRKHDAELIFAAPLPGIGARAALPAIAIGSRNAIAFEEILVAGQNMFTMARAATAKTRLIDTGSRDDDCAALLQFANWPACGGVAYGVLDDSSRAAQKTLPVRQALPLGLSRLSINCIRSLSLRRL